MKNLDVQRPPRPEENCPDTEACGPGIQNGGSAPVAHGMLRDNNRQTTNRIGCLPAQLTAHALKSVTSQGVLPIAAGLSLRAPVIQDEQFPGIPHALILFCTGGRGWCELSGCRHKIRAGDLIVFSPETYRDFRLGSRKHSRVGWIHAVGTNLNIFFRKFGMTMEKPLLITVDEPKLGALFDKLFHGLKAANSVDDLTRVSQTLQTLLNLIIRRHCEGHNGDWQPIKQIEQAIDYMKLHLDKPLHVTTLAALANISPSHFFSLFKRHTNCAPIEYFTRMRMACARHLLDSTSSSVKEIATVLGYDDPLYFSRVFKLAMHDSPTKYRTRSGNSRWDRDAAG